jgi:hypothetical protein
MRALSWFLGIALGMVAGYAVLEGGVLAILVLVPAMVWAARERARPFGLGGLFVGLGTGAGGLIVLADVRCAGSNVSRPDSFSQCVVPDITPYLVAAGVVIGLGVVLSLLAVARAGASTR